MTTLETTTRNANLTDLVGILKTQQARKLDMVVPASKIRSREGNLVVKGAEAVITEDGVTTTDGIYRPTAVADEGIASKLNIPLTYVRRLRLERPDIYDANVNAWLAGKVIVKGGERTVVAAPDERSFLLRTFRGDEGGEGVLRGVLSDKFAIYDNLDVLMAALDGVRAAGVPIEIAGADLSDRRMYVRIVAPEVQALAPDLLKNYRSPFSGQRGADNPTVFAGFEIKNSEVGNGAFTITPRLVFEVCTNGMTVTKDAMRAVHLGSRMDEGLIQWTADTEEKNVALIKAKTRDAVATFLDVDYMRHVIADVEKQAGKPVANAVETIKVVAKKLAFDEETAAGILDHFIKGADATAGGVMQAMTSFAQTVQDADAANDLEANALRGLELAAAAE
jgi:hypothetical protein